MTKVAFLAGVAGLAIVIGIQFRFDSKEPNRKRTSDLRVEVKASSAEIGIPGITKMYQGELINTGHLPVKVRVCDALTDAMYREVHVAHVIERWDRGSTQWRTLWKMSPGEFCRPYPTGIVEGHIKQLSLPPGERISTGEIAIQASEDVRLGDRLRFVVFPYDDDGVTSIPSAPFEVDERPRRR